jgi:hypothetical protein
VAKVKLSSNLTDLTSGIIRVGLISLEVLTRDEGGVAMSYGNYGPPWGTIMAKKKLKEAEDVFTDWRTRLIEVGQRLLREIEKGNVSKEAKREFRDFIEEAKRYRHLS